MCKVLIDNKGRKICNFLPCVDCVVEVRMISENVLISCVQVRLQFEDNHPNVVFTVPIDKIKDIQWQDKDLACWFNPDISDRAAKRYLEEAVRLAANNAPRKKSYQLNSPGMFKIEGEVLFCTGREVIKPLGGSLKTEIELQSMKQFLEIDTELSEGQATDGMFDFISLSPNPGRIMLAYKLIYLMRQAYVDVGAMPKFCIYLYGKTGTNKTTMSSFLTQMYNRSNGIVPPQRLNASIAAAVKMLSEAYEDVIVLDDLFPADSKTVRKKQEETLIEITRYIADGVTPAKVNGKKLLEVPPKCGVIFTGEYVIGGGSDAARLLPVEMSQPDGEKLKYFQDHPLIISTFYYFYIKWFVENYKEIVPLLKEWLNQYRKINLGIHPRLWETHFFFNTTYALLMQYCCDKNFLQSKDAIQFQSSFRNLLEELVWEQERNVDQKIVTKQETESKNYLNCIRVLYREKQLSIADRVGDFNKEVNDGVIHRERLYLRGDKLISYFPEADLSEIVEGLASQGVLEVSKTSYTKQISALNGLRFYVIPLKYLV